MTGIVAKHLLFLLLLLYMFIRLHHNKSYQKRGQVKRSAGKSSRKKNSTSNFFLFPSVHFIWRSPVLRSGFVSLGYIVPGYEQKKNSTKIRNEWHTKKERAKREKKENTSCSHARKIANSNRLRFLLLSTFQNPIDESWRSRTRVLCVPMYMYRVFMLTQAWIWWWWCVR